jgi:hypothetical protein
MTLMLLENLTADQPTQAPATAWRDSVAARWRPRAPVPQEWQEGCHETASLAYKPSAQHHWRAAARLRLALLGAVEPSFRGVAGHPDGLQKLMCDADLRSRADAAIGTAALLLDIGGKEAVVRAMRRIALEHAAIEALREAVLHRLQAVVRGRIGAGSAAAAAGRLDRQAAVALARASAAFHDMDAQVEAQLGDILVTLAAASSQARGLRLLIERAAQDAVATQDVLGAWDGSVAAR